MNTQLLIKCIEFYIDHLTDSGKICPTIDQMKEIIQLDQIKNELIDQIKNELIAKFTSKA